jgi:hypothetical protein
MAIQREIPREAKLDNGLEYAVHGVGCRFTTSTGLEVDVDVDNDGNEIFESWRLFNFANSDPAFGELSVDDLTAAALRLARSGELRQVRPGWFAAA